MPSTSNARPYSHLIVTPDIKARNPEPLEAIASEARQTAEHLEQLHHQVTAANARRENAADSPGFNEGHDRYREWAADISRGASYFRGRAELFSRMAEAMRDVDAAHDNIITNAHSEIAAAKTNAEKALIIAQNNGFARTTSINGVEMIGAYYSQFKQGYGSDATAISGRLGTLPQDGPGPQPVPDDSGGIKLPVDRKRKPGDTDAGIPNDHPEVNSDPATAASTASGRQPVGGELVDAQSGSGTAAPPPAATTPVSSAISPPRSTSAASGAPSTGISGVPGGFGGGGVPGGGGGMPGGLAGLGGGASPLSALSSGPGGLPGTTTPTGLSGVPGSGGVPSVPGSGATVDPSAITRAATAGGAAAGAVPPLSPPPALPGPPPPAAGPVAGAAPAAPAMPAGLAASGAHTPPPPVASGGPVAAAPPPAGGMMLPPPGMGGPAAPLAPGGGPSGATVPATVPAPTGGSSSSGSGVTANAGPTVVPVSVVTEAGIAAGREPSTMCWRTRLAWELARPGDPRKYPLDWAAGVFRSASVSATVVMSNDGSGYVPEGVYLPRDVRLLVADPLVDKDFRDYWFGWQDPARVLLAYAGLRPTVSGRWWRRRR